MKLTKIIITIAITIALATETIAGNTDTERNPTLVALTTLQEAGPPLLPKPNGFKTVSRFLQQGVGNTRAADHCHKEEEVCYIQDGATSTCCNNKCVFLTTDNQNCGACKRKCKFTQVCCRGQCVETAFDKRHCGACNHRCNPGEYCVYGMCNYA